MTAEKYVKQITKKVMCSSKKRREIKRQLLAEINERIAHGEDLKAIISEMGTAEEIAERIFQIR